MSDETMPIRAEGETPGKLLLKRLGVLWACISVACVLYAVFASEAGRAHPIVEVSFLIFLLLAIPTAEVLILRRSAHDYRAYTFPPGQSAYSFKFMRSRWFLFYTKLEIAFFVLGLFIALWGVRQLRDFFILGPLGTAISLLWVWRIANRMFRDQYSTQT